jgi:hypothetical protein
MTSADETSEGLVEPTDEGLWIHFTSAHNVAVSTAPNGTVICAYGTELLLTDEIIALSRGRDGHSTLLDRIERGDCGIHLGRWPADLPRLQPGSFEWHDAREAARKRAWSVEEEAERRAALSRVQAEFGDVSTSRTLMTTRG